MRFTLHHLLFGLFAASVIGCTVGDGDLPPLPDADFDVGVSDDDESDTSDEFPDPIVETCSEESMGSTLGRECTTTASCSDGCFCNGAEECEGGECVAGEVPCTDDIECTADACLEETDACYRMPRHDMCLDDDRCNGDEICDTMLGCKPAAPLYCNDDSSCTVDTCEASTGCVFTLRDLDADGFVAGTCGGEDCDDDPRTGISTHPDALEVCDNRRDDNCDGFRDFLDASCEPTNDDCSNATELTRTGTHSASTDGPSVNGDFTLSCGNVASSAYDVVFSFELAETKDLRATVAGLSSAVISLREADKCDTGPDTRCDAGTPAALLVRSLEPGSYVLIVKTASRASFDLNLQFEDPTEDPHVDVCDSETAILPTDGSLSTGAFVDAADNYTLSCQTSGAARDAAYRFTLDAPKDVRVWEARYTTASGWSNTAFISIVTDCADSETNVGCITGGTTPSGSSSELHRRNLEAGTYYLVLEPYRFETEPLSWSFRSEITDPVPRNEGDACADPIDISSTMGSITLASLEELDHGTSCGGANVTSHRDAVFSFTLTETKDVTLAVNAGGSHWVALETSCGDLESEIRCRAPTATTSTNVFHSLEVGTYYVVVSRSASGVGTTPVTAQVTLSDPTPVPGNDQCVDAIDVNTTPPYRETGTLLDFADDEDSCSNTIRPDAFYRLVLTETSSVTAIARRVSGSGNVYLELRDACANDLEGEYSLCPPGDDSGATVTSGSTANLDVPSLEAGTYYLVVEMDITDPGDVDLQVFVTAP